jgi:hypothetical protein
MKKSMVINEMNQKFDNCKFISYITSRFRSFIYILCLIDLVMLVCIYVILFQCENLFVLSHYCLLRSRFILVRFWHDWMQAVHLIFVLVLLCMRFVQNIFALLLFKYIFACFVFTDYPLSPWNRQSTCKR